MVLILVLLVPFPLGLLVRNRMAANLAFGVLAVHLFVFQTAQLMMEWVRGSTHAFGDVDDPSWSWLGDTWGYYVVNLVLLAVGFGLVAAGHKVRARRDRGRGVLEVSQVQG
jgi:hypothetical protein